MRLEQIPISLIEKIPLPFMRWHPYITEINEERVIFTFPSIHYSSSLRDFTQELGGSEELADLLAKEFYSFSIKQYNIYCNFKKA